MARRRRDSRGRFLRRGARARTHRRRTHARRNAAIPFYNRPRRRRRHARRNAAIPFYNRRHRRHRRNPAGLKLPFFGTVIPPLETIGLGVAGCAGQRLMFKQVVNRYMPDMMPWPVNTLLSAAGVGFLARLVLGRERGNKVAVGAFICAADQIAMGYVYPTIGLDAYLDPGMHAYLDPGMGQYMNPGAVLPAMTRGGGEELSGLYDEDYGMHGADRLDAGNRI